MSDAKSTKLTIRADRPTAIASPSANANLAALGFNIPFIALRNPRLAIELLKLYDEAHAIQESDAPAPEEDHALFLSELDQYNNA